jgi:hypothetical protein
LTELRRRSDGHAGRRRTDDAHGSRRDQQRRGTVYVENFKREMMRSKKYRARDIYPNLSPELQKVFEEWQKTHKKEGVKPNVGG